MTGESIFHLPAQEGQVLFAGGLGAILKVPSSATGGAVSIVEHTLVSGVIGAPMHRHEHEDEISHVVEGELTVQIGSEIYLVRPGEFIVKPRSRFHTFWNAGAEIVRFLEVIAPGGFEGYFEELGVLLAGPEAAPVEAILALAGRYGLEFDLASLPELLETHHLRLPTPDDGETAKDAAHP